MVNLFIINLNLIFATMKFLKDFFYIVFCLIKKKNIYIGRLFIGDTRSYYLNIFYNNYYIHKNKIKFYKVFFSTKNSNKLFFDSVKFAKNSSTSPLLRLNKLIKFLEIKYEDYDFFDVGSGYGIALHYIIKNFNFKNYYGLEFDKYLVNKSIENLKTLKKKSYIIHDDANKFSLTNSKKLIYMANPFNEYVYKKFLKNNLNTLRNNQCIIINLYDIYSEDLKKLSKKKFNFLNGSSVYFF